MYQLQSKPPNLIEMPVIVFEKILLYLPYDTIAKNRLVSQRFNSTGQSLLNRGFQKAIQFHSTTYKDVRSKLPRRESKRLDHPLSRHNNILSAVDTRLSLLKMSYMKYIQLNLCCFIPGKVIDEILSIIRLVSFNSSNLMDFTLSQVHNVLTELRDISSMAVDYFEDKTVPTFKCSNPFMSLAPVTLSNSSSSSSSRLNSSCGSGLVSGSANVDFLKYSDIGLDVELKTAFEKINTLPTYNSKVSDQEIELMVKALRRNTEGKKNKMERCYEEMSKKVNELSRRVQEQERVIAEQRKLLTEHSIRFTSHSDRINEIINSSVSAEVFDLSCEVSERESDDESTQRSFIRSSDSNEDHDAANRKSLVEDYGMDSSASNDWDSQFVEEGETSGYYYKKNDLLKRRHVQESSSDSYDSDDSDLLISMMEKGNATKKYLKSMSGEGIKRLKPACVNQPSTTTENEPMAVEKVLSAIKGVSKAHHDVAKEKKRKKRCSLRAKMSQSMKVKSKLNSGFDLVGEVLTNKAALLDIPQKNIDRPKKNIEMPQKHLDMSQKTLDMPQKNLDVHQETSHLQQNSVLPHSTPKNSKTVGCSPLSLLKTPDGRLVLIKPKRRKGSFEPLSQRRLRQRHRYNKVAALDRKKRLAAMKSKIKEAEERVGKLQKELQIDRKNETSSS